MIISTILYIYNNLYFRVVVKVSYFSLSGLNLIKHLRPIIEDMWIRYICIKYIYKIRFRVDIKLKSYSINIAKINLK